MNPKPIAIYVEGSVSTIVLHPTEDLFRTVGSSDNTDVCNYILHVLKESFPFMRRGEGRWASASLVGNFYQRLYGLITISLTSAPTKQDYLNNFKFYANPFDGLLIYNCGSGLAKWVSGEIVKIYPKPINIAEDRAFPHDFIEEEKRESDIEYFDDVEETYLSELEFEEF